MKSLFSIFLLIILICFSQAALAQDFGQLLKAVDKLEASLKQMVENEHGQREEAITHLTADVKLLKTEVDALKGQPHELAEASSNNQELAGLKSGMNQLAKENLILRNRLDEQSLKFAQLETQVAENSGGGSSTQGTSPYYTQQLVNLSMQIIDLKSELRQYQAEDSHDIATPGPVSVNLPHREAVEETGLEISGFFDVLGSQSSASEDNTEFAINQAEIDFEHQLNDNILAAAAVAYNGDDNVFELAVAAISVNLFDSEDLFVNSLEHISTITKETAAGADQSATAAEQLNRQAEGLQQMVSEFKAKETETA